MQPNKSGIVPGSWTLGWIILAGVVIWPQALPHDIREMAQIAWIVILVPIVILCMIGKTQK
jgi:hypothetical protein